MIKSPARQQLETSTFNVIVPTKPALTVTGSFNKFSASAFSFKSLRTTSPTRKGIVRKIHRLLGKILQVYTYFQVKWLKYLFKINPLMK